MPRNPGTGIYTKPYPDVISDTTIESTVHNGEIADIETDLNTPRPIVAGGTGANNAAGARSNLGAERAMQTVTNYDTHVWENGSFWSAAGATAAPYAGIFSGICYIANNDPNVITVEARDAATGVNNVRQKLGGVWGAWVSEAATYVNTTGDTMTGDLILPATPPTDPNAALNKTAADTHYVNVTGDTMSGAFTCSSSIFTSANFHLSSGNGLYFEGGYTVRLYWDGSNIVSSAGFFAGGIKSGSGYACKQGTAGGYSNTFNYFWTNSVMQQWVDNVNTGNVSVTSDYRAKKNVLDLPSTWDTVKALHPIKFEYNDWTPPWHIPPPPEEGQPKAPSLFMADGVERWGFLAHELQDALIMDAATGYKDTTEEIQSPNPWTVIAALTKALQEAMARIEALEAR